MKKRLKFISYTSAFVLILAMLMGTGKIYSFAKIIENNANVFLTKENQRLAGVKHNEKTQNRAKKASEQILGNGIKFKSSEYSGKENRIVCYTRNVYIELDTYSMQPVFIVYECERGKGVKSRYECEKTLVEFVFRNMPVKAKAKDAEVCCDHIDDHIVQYHIDFAKGTVYIALRRDTGSVIFYDAGELF
ncbi:MAG: hypothetical protein IKL36_04040 [Clostridia bacterium]|nr:hypothetical protein [Clostridia bacterium]